MKTKEFIRGVEELGYFINEHVEHYVITDVDKCFIASINKTVFLQFSTDYSKWDELSDIDKKELFDLLVEYARTPIEDREEEKEFYLKHRRIKGCVIMYLNRNELNGNYYLGDKKCRPHRQKRFTLEEIEKIKEKFNTDLADFELVEVKE